jgi:dienelactone hydrolase
MRISLLALGVLLLATPASAQDGTPVGDLADGRSGKIHFESLTPAGYFQLARKETTQKTVVFGELALPPNTTGRIPAIVISHGSGGASEEREGRWAGILRAQGLATFIVDTFTPRNIRETATNQAQLSTAVSVADALAALRLLTTHPRIDPQRIAVMGFSKGGQVAMYTALEPFRSAAAGDAKFAAHIALYPYCSDWYQSQRTTSAPMLFLLGGLDDYTPAAPCQGYAEWFKSRGTETTVVVYANAYHGFDSSQQRAFYRDMVTGRNCDMAVDLDRFTVRSRNTGEDITRNAAAYGRNCLSRGATLGNDGEARRRAPEDIATFLKAALRL